MTELEAGGKKRGENGDLINSCAITVLTGHDATGKTKTKSKPIWGQSQLDSPQVTPPGASAGRRLRVLKRPLCWEWHGARGQDQPCWGTSHPSMIKARGTRYLLLLCVLMFSSHCHSQRRSAESKHPGHVVSQCNFQVGKESVLGEFLHGFLDTNQSQVTGSVCLSYRTWDVRSPGLKPWPRLHLGHWGLRDKVSSVPISPGHGKKGKIRVS